METMTQRLLADLEQRGLWHIPSATLQEMVVAPGASRFVFGLDFPWNGIEATRRHLQVVESRDIAVSEKELILGGKLLRLLGEARDAPQ